MTVNKDFDVHSVLLRNISYILKFIKAVQLTDLTFESISDVFTKFGQEQKSERRNRRR